MPLKNVPKPVLFLLLEEGFFVLGFLLRVDSFMTEDFLDTDGVYYDGWYSSSIYGRLWRVDSSSIEFSSSVAIFYAIIWGYAFGKVAADLIAANFAAYTSD